MDPETLRADIPACQECVFLNTGASGPSPRRIVDAVTGYHERHKFEAPCSEGMYELASETRGRARVSRWRVRTSPRYRVRLGTG